MEYPKWTCFDCAKKHGGKATAEVFTVHENVCDICLQCKQVTDPRDFSYPKFKKSPNFLKRITSLIEMYNKLDADGSDWILKEIEKLTEELRTYLDTKHEPAVFFPGIERTNIRKGSRPLK